MAGLDWNQIVEFYKRFGGRNVSPSETPHAQYWLGKNPADLQAALQKAAPPPNPAQSLEALIVDKGPTAYDANIRKNLGLDLQTGGARPTSGMAQIGNPGTIGNYTPRAATPDPLMALLAQYKPPPAPTSPVPPGPPGPPKPPVVLPQPQVVAPQPRAWVPGRNAR
jgi:hypothetical protein